MKSFLHTALFLMALYAPVVVLAQGNEYFWTEAAGGSARELLFNATRDKDGNLYLVGSTNSRTLAFGTINLTTSITEKAYLAKYDADGHVIWAKILSDQDADATNVAIDSEGNAYVIGYYETDSLVLGSTTLHNRATTAGTNDVFLAKYTTDGDLIWARSGGGADGEEEIYGLALDANDNVYVSGHYYSTTMSMGPYTITKFPDDYSSDAFTAKYDKDGTVQWLKSIGGDQMEYNTCLVTDQNNNAYICMMSSSNALSFNGTSYTGNFSNAYVFQYDTDGNESWSTATVTTNDGSTWPGELFVDGDDLYFTGFSGSDTVTFGTHQLVSTSHQRRGFFVKYDLPTHGIVWAKSIDASCAPSSVAVDSDNKVYVTGTFYQETFSFGASTLYCSDADGENGMVLQFDAQGNPIQAVAPDAAAGTGFGQVICDEANNLYIIGGFGDLSLDFGNTPLTNEGTDNTQDIFLAKMKFGTVVITSTTTVENREAPMSFPNPTQGHFHLSGLGMNTYTLHVYSSTGKMVHQSEVSSATDIDLTGQPKGVYFLELQNDADKPAMGKIVIQ